MISASDPFRALRARAVVVRSAAVAATVELKCPIIGCDYQTTLVLGMGQDDDARTFADQALWLRLEHPNHPSASPQPGYEW
jgi:hypothetical protein